MHVSRSDLATRRPQFPAYRPREAGDSETLKNAVFGVIPQMRYLRSRPRCCGCKGRAHAMVGRRSALHRRKLRLRMRVVPPDVPICERLGRDPVGVDGNRHGQRNGDQDVMLAREVRLVGQKDGEDDRGETARAGPAQEHQSGTPGTAAQHRKGDREHPDNGQAQHHIQRELAL